MSVRSPRGLSLLLLLGRSLRHRKSRSLAQLLALTVSAAVATAMLTLYVSLDQKLHHQFRSFGANIVITARSTLQNPSATPALPDTALATARSLIGTKGKVVPFAYVVAQMPDGKSVVVVGTDMDGARSLHPWWQVSEGPAVPTSGTTSVPVLTGTLAAQALHTDTFSLTYSGHILALRAAGTLRSGDADDSRIFLPLQILTGWTGEQPDTLQVQAAGTSQEVEAIVEQLRHALPNADVHAIHQLVDAEANVVSRTRSLMFSSLLLISLTVAICVLATLTASVLERRHDFAVMKALGATQHRVSTLFLLEALILAICGVLCGYILGCGIAWLIGEWNFHTSIPPLWQIAPQVLVLNLVVAAIAAAAPMRILQRLEPATLLRGE